LNEYLISDPVQEAAFSCNSGIIMKLQRSVGFNDGKRLVYRPREVICIVTTRERCRRGAHGNLTNPGVEYMTVEKREVYDSLWCTREVVIIPSTKWGEILYGVPSRSW
jgi:hypothetical protein